MTCFRMESGETLNRYCKRNGICYMVVYNHIERGASVEDAIRFTLENKKIGKALNNCKHFLSNGKTLRGACLENGLPLSNCYRLLSMGYTPDEVFFLISKRRSKK